MTNPGTGSVRYPLAPRFYSQPYENLRNQWIARSIQDRQQVLRFARVEAFREGHHELTGQNATWATIRGAASATTTLEPSGTGLLLSLKADTTTDQWDDLYRIFLAFDLTGVLRADSVVAGARLVVRPINNTTGSAPWVDSYSGEVVLVAGPASDSGTPVDADFNDYGTTDLAESTVTLAAGDVAQTIEYILNDSGVAHLSVSAPTMFGLRLSHDVDNTPPTWSSAAEDTARFYNDATIRTPAFLDLLYYY